MSTTNVPVSVQAFAPPAAAGDDLSRYQSRFQTFLARGRWLAVGAIGVWALACVATLQVHQEATRVIGHDTAPSIVAAEYIHSLLADANGELADMLLTNEGDAGRFSGLFQDDIRDAVASLVTASQNITYGDAEKVPITTVMRGVAQYEELVGRARALGRDPRATQLALSADKLMRETILPAAVALDKANDDQLTTAYGQKSQLAELTGDLRWLLAAGALGVLLVMQYRCFRSTNRIINPGLFAATVLVVTVSGYCGLIDAQAKAELRTAKQDAFDSIYALSNLQAVANDAHTAESFWLLAYDDPAARAKYADLFRQLSTQIVGVDMDTATASVAAHRTFPGLMGNELANITFNGEAEAAERTLNGWGEYQAIDGKLRALEDGGHKADALALDVGQLTGVFSRFDYALQETVKINRDAFDTAIAQSEAQIGAATYAGVGFAALLAAFAVWYGVRLRLREYEF